MPLPRLRSRTSVHWWRTRSRYRRYSSIHHAVAATNPRSESPAAACPIRRLITASPTAPEVLLGNFSRHFQQYNTPSIVVCAPQELHFRLMLITALVANRVSFSCVYEVGIGPTADIPRGRATHFSVANSAWQYRHRRLVALRFRRAQCLDRGVPPARYAPGLQRQSWRGHMRRPHDPHHLR